MYFYSDTNEETLFNSEYVLIAFLKLFLEQSLCFQVFFLLKIVKHWYVGWSTAGTLLVHYRSTVDPLQVHCWSTIGPLLVHCWSTVECWSTVGPLLIHFWSTVECWSTDGPPVGPLLVHYWSTIVVELFAVNLFRRLNLNWIEDSTSRDRVFKNIPRGVIEQEGSRGQGVIEQEEGDKGW